MCILPGHAQLQAEGFAAAGHDPDMEGQYLAFLPVHYAEQWTAKKQMRTIRPELYTYDSTYEVIRRKSAARTPAEVKFYDLLMTMAVA